MDFVEVSKVNIHKQQQLSLKLRILFNSTIEDKHKYQKVKVIM